MNVNAHCVRQVVHMVTAARGAEEYYTVEHHATRLEGVGEARERDRLASEVPNIIYRNHKNIFCIIIFLFSGLDRPPLRRHHRQQLRLRDEDQQTDLRRGAQDRCRHRRPFERQRQEDQVCHQRTTAQRFCISQLPRFRGYPSLPPDRQQNHAVQAAEER